MAPGHDKTDGEAADQTQFHAGRPGTAVPPAEDHPHEVLSEPEDTDTEKASRRDEETEETEEHCDPDPVGPEGLNTGVLVDPDILAARTRTHSRASSARSRPLTVVPRTKRRGLFATLVIIPEVERPYDYSRKTKWIITAVVAVAAAGGPIGSNIMYRMCRPRRRAGDPTSWACEMRTARVMRLT